MIPSNARSHKFLKLAFLVALNRICIKYNLISPRNASFTTIESNSTLVNCLPYRLFLRAPQTCKTSFSPRFSFHREFRSKSRIFFIKIIYNNKSDHGLFQEWSRIKVHEIERDRILIMNRVTKAELNCDLIGNRISIFPFFGAIQLIPINC